MLTTTVTTAEQQPPPVPWVFAKGHSAAASGKELPLGKLFVVPEALLVPDSLRAWQRPLLTDREHRGVFGEIPKGWMCPAPPQPSGTSRWVRAMRTPRALLPSALGSTSWGLRWNFSPHSRGAAAPACISTGFSRAVLIISSVSRFLGLEASRKREKSSQQESAKSP